MISRRLGRPTDPLRMTRERRTDRTLRENCLLSFPVKDWPIQEGKTTSLPRASAATSVREATTLFSCGATMEEGSSPAVAVDTRSTAERIPERREDNRFIE